MSKKGKDGIRGEYASMKLRKPEKYSKMFELSCNAVNTEVVRHKKNKTTERTPQKHTEKSQRSISPLSNKSRSKSQISKSPYLQHLQDQSLSYLKKK
jgi:hypothetical protein